MTAWLRSAAMILGFALGIAFSAPVAASQQLETETFAVERMTCALCPITVRKAMEDVAGVQSVTVDYDGRTATVVFDATETTAAEIAEASGRAGYPARPLGE